MKITPTLLATSLTLLLPCSLVFATPKVITSIKPVHSLVAGVMGETGNPKLIVDGAASPHTHNLRPSQARDLQAADLIFWTGPQLETFLEKPMQTLGQNAVVVTLADTPGIIKLDQREGGAFDAHADHGGHESHDNDHGSHDDKHESHDAKHENHDDDHDSHDVKHDSHDDENESHDHDAHDHHDETDPHIWLDPQNAIVLVKQIEKSLSAADPEHAEEYKANASALTKRLQDLINETTTSLEPVKDRPFVVFHDAYHYFENRFGLSAAGTITVNPEIMPGAGRVAEIQEKIRELDVACVFAEPQFEPKIITVVAESSNAKSGVLDPLGAEIDNGPDLYFELIHNMATSMQSCLTPTN